MLLFFTFLQLNNWDDWRSEDITSAVSAVHSMGLKAFAATRSNFYTATVENHLAIYRKGVDVAYTYNVPNAVTARKIVNAENTVIPP